VERFEAYGTWWIPSGHDSHVSGVVTIDSENNAVLSTYGEQLVDFEQAHVQPIHGATNRGPITLLGCTLQTHALISTLSSGSVSQQIKCDTVLEGEHVAQNFSSNFVRLAVKNLQSWSQIASLQTLGNNYQITKENRIGFYYTIQNSPIAIMPDGSTIRINVDPHWKMGTVSELAPSTTSR